VTAAVGRNATQDKAQNPARYERSTEPGSCRIGVMPRTATGKEGLTVAGRIRVQHRTAVSTAAG